MDGAAFPEFFARHEADVQILPECDCWIWMLRIEENGYGKLMWRKISQRPLWAHRAFFIAANGPDIDGRLVCHSCDVRQCVNPNHLYLGTYADNMRDMRRRGRQSKGESRPKAKLTETDVRIIRRRVGSGELQLDLADEFGVSKTTISNVTNRVSWRHI